MQVKDRPALSRSVLHLLHRAGQSADDLFARELPESDLTPRQFAVLVALAGQDTASQTEIVAATGIDRSTLADIVKRLLQRGLLARRRSKSDARAYAVRLTPAGEHVLQTALPAADRVSERMLKLLPAARRTEFLDALSEIVRQLGTGVGTAALSIRERR